MRAELRRLSAEAQAPLLEAHDGFDWDGIEVRGDLLLASNESVMGRRGLRPPGAAAGPADRAGPRRTARRRPSPPED